MLLLAPDTVTLTRPPGTVDDHGWALDTPVTAVGTFAGSLQGWTPTPAFQATQGADSGPHAPVGWASAVLYLDDDVDVRPGDRATVGDTTWTVLAVVPVPDPVGGQAGALRCQVTREGLT